MLYEVITIDAIAEWNESKAVALIIQHIANTGELIADGWVDDGNAAPE